MLEYLVGKLDVLLSGVVSVGYLIFSIIAFSFSLSYWVGRLIVSYAITVISTFGDILRAVVTLVQVLTEDYYVFLADVADKVSSVCKSLQNAVERIVLLVLNSVLSLALLVESVCSISLSIALSFQSALSAIITSVLSTILLLRDSIILVGISIWKAISFVPNSALYMKNIVVSFIIHFMKVFHAVVSDLRNNVYDGVHCIQKSVSEIPIESVYGLCLGITIMYVMVKYRRRVLHSSAMSVVYLLQQSQWTLVTAWACLETFTLWLLTNQRAPVHIEHVEDDLLDSEESSGEDQGSDEMQQQHVHVQQRPANMPVTPVKSESTADLERKLQQEQEERLCIVCQDQPRCTIILPCRHVCLCYECCGAIKRTHGRCPVCRNLVRRTMKVYI